MVGNKNWYKTPMVYINGKNLRGLCAGIISTMGGEKKKVVPWLVWHPAPVITAQ